MAKIFSALVRYDSRLALKGGFMDISFADIKSQ
jgi:hypothetical protein